jgi:hypothetical protein
MKAMFYNNNKDQVKFKEDLLYRKLSVAKLNSWSKIRKLVIFIYMKDKCKLGMEAKIL